MIHMISAMQIIVQQISYDGSILEVIRNQCGIVGITKWCQMVSRHNRYTGLACVRLICEELSVVLKLAKQSWLPPCLSVIMSCKQKAVGMITVVCLDGDGLSPRHHSCLIKFKLN